MSANAAPLLDRHRIFHSRNVDEAYAFLRSKEFQLQGIERRDGQFDMRINGVYFPGMWLGCIQYGLPVEVRAVQRDDYWLQLPVSGQLEVVGAGASVACDRRRAAVASARSDFYLVRSGRGCRGIRLSLTKANLVGQLAALLGEPPGGATLEFAPAMDLTEGYGRSLAQHLLAAIASLDDADSLLLDPMTTTAFEQFIMTALLACHPHNYSAALRRLEKPIAPRDVRRAVEYIEGHLDQPITVSDLVEAAGVAGRTLFMHFKSFKGVSPMRYLREARLAAARQALLRPHPDARVTDIAMNSGFTHMGRFSVAYRRRFGESPSETLGGRKATVQRQSSPQSRRGETR